MLRFAVFIATTLVTACNSEIYVRDGVTDGDTFYLSDRALTDDSPVLQSWVAYSLARSACQLEIGGENPARVSSYGCEFTARRILLDTWDEKRSGQTTVRDEYLDSLIRVREAGYLDEYVVHYFQRKEWLVPAEVDVRGFQDWRRQNLRRHKPETHIIGSWNYSQRHR